MRNINALPLACLLLLAACKKEDDAGNPPPPAPSPPPAVNRAPVADAGADAAAMTGAVVSLSAAGSSDPDADSLTYSWVIISGPAGGMISNASQSAASFQATVAGTYVLEVTVRDPGNLSSVDSVTLTLSDPAPPPPAFGIAGLPAHVIEGTAGTLMITLPAPAPAGGTLVTLLSSNPADQGKLHARGAGTGHHGRMGPHFGVRGVARRSRDARGTRRCRRTSRARCPRRAWPRAPARDGSWEK